MGLLGIVGVGVNQMNTQTALEKLDRYIRARYPLISVVSHEESRV